MAAPSSDQMNENTTSNSTNINSEPIADIKNVLHKLSTILGTSESMSIETTTRKSSSEIISELFGAFNAAPPILPETAETVNECSDHDIRIRLNRPEESLENELSPKKSSSRKKHKHKKKSSGKSKKHKKRLKSDKDSSPRSKRATVKNKSSDDQSPKPNKHEEKKTLTNRGSDQPFDSYISTSSRKESPRSTDRMPRLGTSTSNGGDVVKNTEVKIDTNNFLSTNVGNNDQSDTKKGIDSTNICGNSNKASSKISIKNLKFSSVFKATLKEVEEQARAKAEMYEEGEISNSSDNGHSDKNSHESDEPSSIPREILSTKTASSGSKSHSKRRQSRSPSRRSVPTKRRKDSKSESCRHKHRSSENSRHHSHNDPVKRRDSRSRSRDSRSRRKVDNGYENRSRDRSSNKDRNQIKTLDLREKLSEKHHNGHSHRRRSEDRHDYGEHSDVKHDHGKRRRERSISPIDKKKLMAIARKNALFLLEQGALPGPIGQEKLVNIKSGGKSVAELTDFCKRLSKKESRISGSEDENDNDSSDSEAEKRPFNHPFQIKERPLNIVMNIRNSVPVPANALLNKASDQMLRVQFPVSSGTQHRKTESEWVPVEPKTSVPKQLLAITAPPLAEPLPVPSPIAPPPVFPEPPTVKHDISDIVSQRLRAMRQLQENPNDVQALSAMYVANQEMKTWAESKQLPGQFTGSTDVRMLTVAQLSAGAQAYVRKDQFVTAAPVTGGMGMSLLQKMGWRPGEGLGKNKAGSLEPLSLEIKMDKKGLVTQEDLKRNVITRPGGRINTNNKKLSEKHPISLLIEFCARRRWKPPFFEIASESGPDHMKNFLFRVQVNGVNYEPAITSPNKKLAKAEAATVCLRALGVPID